MGKVRANHFDKFPERNSKEELNPFSIWSHDKGRYDTSSSIQYNVLAKEPCKGSLDE